MRTRTVTALLVAAAVSAGAAQSAGEQAAKPAAKPAAAHVMVKADDVKWGPAPPALPPGAQLAVVDGDPGKTGAYTLRLKLPDGYKVAPHWHPTDENITVLQGLFKLGMGDAINETAATELAPGSFARVPKQMHHYAVAKGETTVQVSGMGPFVLNYVNPADDPSKKK